PDARRGWRWSLAMALLVALVLVPWTFQPILRPDAGAALYRQAARWIAETQPRDAVLLDRKPLVAFYSERRWVPLPRIGPDELLAAARHAGAGPRRSRGRRGGGASARSRPAGPRDSASELATARAG